MLQFHTTLRQLKHTNSGFPHMMNRTVFASESRKKRVFVQESNRLFCCVCAVCLCCGLCTETEPEFLYIRIERTYATDIRVVEHCTRRVRS